MRDRAQLKRRRRAGEGNRTAGRAGGARRPLVELTPLEQRVFMSAATVVENSWEGAATDTSTAWWSVTTTTLRSDATDHYLQASNGGSITLSVAGGSTSAVPAGAGTLSFDLYVIDDAGPTNLPPSGLPGTVSVTGTSGTEKATVLSRSLSATPVADPSIHYNLNNDTHAYPPPHSLCSYSVWDYIYHFDVPFNHKAGTALNLSFKVDGMDSASGMNPKWGIDKAVVGVQVADSGCNCGGAAATAGGNSSANAGGVGSPGGYGTPVTTAVQVSNKPQAGTGDGTSGNNVVAPGAPFLTEVGSGRISAVDGGIASRWFDDDGSGNFVGKFGLQDKLTHDTTNHEYLIADTGGSVSHYYDFDTGVAAARRGKLKSVVDPKGNATSYAYDGTTNLLTEIAQSTTVGTVTTKEYFQYTYLTSPNVNAGKVDTVTLKQKTWDTATPFSQSEGSVSYTTVRSSANTYYGTGSSNGTLGDLKTVTVNDASANPIDNSYFRYYTTSSATGYAGALKYSLGPASYARAFAALGSLDSASDAALAPYADLYYEYDDYQRVTKKTAQGEGCSSCSGGQGTYTYAYDSSANDSGTNAWRSKIVERLPDGNQNIEYYNAFNQPMLTVFQELAAGKAIGSITHTTTTATVTTSATHGFAIGDLVVISGASLGAYNGTFTVTGVTSTTFTYTMATDPGANPTLSSATAAGVSKQWGTFTKYDAAGRAVWVAQPSAVNLPSNVTTLEQYGDLLNSVSGNYQYLNDASGLINVTNYGTSSAGVTLQTGSSTASVGDGEVLGYVKDTDVQKGELGTPVKVEAWTYYAHKYQPSGAAAVTVFPVATETVYGATNGTDARLTRYNYTFASDAASYYTTRVQSQTITHTTVTTAHHGSNTGVQSSAYFDAYGRTIWAKDEDGYLTYTAYDQATGSVVKRIVDVDTTKTSDFAGLPSGWTTPSGGGLHLITTDAVDSLGRTTQETDPRGHVAYLRYNDANHEVRSYRGWTSSASGTNTVYAPTGSVVVSREDQSGSYRESLTFAYTPAAASTPTGTESVTVSNIQGLSRAFTSTGGQLDHTDKYVSLAGLTYGSGTSLGTVGTNFLRTSYAYQGRGQLKRVQAPDGTIHWTVYDALSRVVSQWTGTNDAGATNADPTGGGASGNNMVKVAENVYDGGGIGDGNVTQSRAVFGGGGSDYYATDYAYDFRDRLTDRRGPDKVATQLTLDNLGQATEADTYADADADFTIDSGELRGMATSAFDELGRTYQSTVFNVDPSSGTVGHSLTNNTWYNGRGMAVKIASASGLLQKAAYDGAGRQVASYVSYDSGTNEATYNGALDVAGDTVISQVKTIYDAAGNAVVNTSYNRLEADTTTTGALGAATNAAFIQTAVSLYDAADRLVQTTNYGRDNGTSQRYVFATNGAVIDTKDWTGATASDGIPDAAQPTAAAPAPAPNSSDDYIVAKYAYDAGGRPYRTTDNLGHVTQTNFDVAGRKTTVIENYVDGTAAEIETDTDRTTQFLYDSAGRLSKQRALDPKGSGNGVQQQDTTYLYESPFDGSWVSNTIHPDSSDTTSSGGDQVKTQRDRLGRVIETHDQRNVGHNFYYDAAGRPSLDAAASLPGGVANDVLSIGRAYDDLGRLATITSYSNTAGTGTPVNQVAYTYDGWGNVVKSQQSHSGAVVSGTTPHVDYTYDDGTSGTNTAALYIRPSKVTYPGGKQVFYNYGSGTATAGLSSRNSYLLNRVDSVADSLAGTNTYAQYLFVGAGRTVKVSHPTTVNGETIAYSLATDGTGAYSGLDRFGRVVQQLWKNSALTGGNYDGYSYTYDRNGNVLAKDNFSSGDPGGHDEAYAYDGLDRLAKFQRGTITSGTIGSVVFTQDWTNGTNTAGLDALGNWSSFNNNGTTQTRTSNAANETTAVTQASGDWIDPTYDASGNMVSGPKAGAETTRQWFEYDAWGRLVRVYNDSAGTKGTLLATYAYDGLGQRIQKVTGGNTDDNYYNENWQIVEVRRAGDTDPREAYVWDQGYIDTPIFREQDTNTDGTVDNTYYYMTDANHNVTALYDPALGSVQERYAYDAYGKVRIYDRLWSNRSTSAMANNILFGGYYYDTETGLNYSRSRYYHPTMGKWVSRDPVGFLDSSNLYEYVGSNPSNASDPTGLWSISRDSYNSFAIATAAEGDTWQSLADASKLDVEELKAWAKPVKDLNSSFVFAIPDVHGTLPENVTKDCRVAIPNTIVVMEGYWNPKGGDEGDGPEPADKWLANEPPLERWIAAWKAEGYRVDIQKRADSGGLSALAEWTTYGFLYSGHNDEGTKPKGLILDDKTKGWPVQFVQAEGLTIAHKLADVRIYACNSLTIGNWGSLKSKAGDIWLASGDFVKENAKPTDGIYKNGKKVEELNY